MADTWRLTLAWRGGNYVGWQRQAEGQSIQAVVEDALASVLGGVATPVTASGRTDAGVHALGQVVSFSTEVERRPYSLMAGLNQRLPLDIAVLDAAVAPPGFDARRWVLRKRYRYRVLNRLGRCPFRAGLTWHWRGPLDVAAMDRAAQALVGRHDLSSFRAAGCSASHPVRLTEAASVRQEGDEVHLEFVGNGFLRHQVRILAGTLVEIGQGWRPPEAMAEILAARSRFCAGRTAPPDGLWLVDVTYGDGPRVASEPSAAGALDLEGDEE